VRRHQNLVSGKLYPTGITPAGSACQHRSSQNQKRVSLMAGELFTATSPEVPALQGTGLNVDDVAPPVPIRTCLGSNVTRRGWHRGGIAFHPRVTKGANDGTPDGCRLPRLPERDRVHAHHQRHRVRSASGRRPSTPGQPTVMSTGLTCANRSER
jgi:hypothetical protein